jgi:hypothetical protein
VRWHLVWTSFLSCLLSSAFCFSDEGLFFPLDKTGSQMLPQRFEYQLLDKDKLLIGDVLVDASQILFSLGATRDNPKVFKLFFQWPAGLLSKGEVVIKDNSGKALWRKSINEKHLKILKQETSIHKQPVRADIAQFNTDGLDAETLVKLKFYPFFHFCAQSEEQLTRVYVCSKELYFAKVNGRTIIQSRDSLKKESYMEINGNVVGDQGAVYLQSPADPVSMRTMLLSGATVEIDTRLRIIDFKDIYRTSDNKVIVRASGTEPVREDLILNKDQNSWTTELNKNRPMVYVKGEGGIPMRQEFILSKNIRPESLKIPFSKDAPAYTYDDTETVFLKTEKNVSLNKIDRTSRLEKISDDEWRWEIRGLRKNSPNRAYIGVKAESGEYIAAHDIFRARRYEATALMMMYPVWFDFKFQQWFSPRFGWSAAYKAYIQKNSGEPDLSALSADLLFRFTAGPHLIEPSHGLLAGMQLLSLSGTTVMAPTAGAFFDFAPPRFFNGMFDRFYTRVKIPMSGTGGSWTLQSSYLIDLLLKKIEPGWSWETGMKLESYQFQSGGTTTSVPRISFVAGISTFF